MRLPVDQSYLRAIGMKPGGKSVGRPRTFRTELEELNDLAPGGAFQFGAVHELIWRARSVVPGSFALLLARAAQSVGGAIVWSDPRRELHPPALEAMGIDLRRLVLLRCKNRAEELWTLGECLRCRGVSATVGVVQSLSRIEARRLQLAAERGGGVGIFLRPFSGMANAHYAAASRWLVQPVPLGKSAGGERGVQRWSVELLHGHGGRIGEVLLLEVDRETRSMRASAALADRSTATAAARASA